MNQIQPKDEKKDKEILRAASIGTRPSDLVFPFFPAVVPGLGQKTSAPIAPDARNDRRTIRGRGFLKKEPAAHLFYSIIKPSPVIETGFFIFRSSKTVGAMSASDPYPLLSSRLSSDLSERAEGSLNSYL